MMRSKDLTDRERKKMSERRYKEKENDRERKAGERIRRKFHDARRPARRICRVVVL